MPQKNEKLRHTFFLVIRNTTVLICLDKIEFFGFFRTLIMSFECFQWKEQYLFNRHE